MRLIIISILSALTITYAIGQKKNLDNGLAVSSYDLVSYFESAPEKGSSKFSHEYKGAVYRFTSADNLTKFKANPEKYLPQYGGWCAYAMAKDGSYVNVDPETYEIRDGKLYLFYNRFFTNTFESWKKEGAEELRIQADKNWEKHGINN